MVHNHQQDHPATEESPNGLYAYTEERPWMHMLLLHFMKVSASNFAGSVSPLDYLSCLFVSHRGEADGMGGYGPSKAALGQYTKICARENPSFIFSCCSPGFINTAMTQGWGASKELLAVDGYTV